jgi:HlyD family secretion protein
MKKKIPILVVALLVLGAVFYFVAMRRGHEIILTGIVTTDQVIVGSEIQGRVERLLVREGDWVTNGQLLVQLQPEERTADMAFYASSKEQSAAQVLQAEADLKFQETQTSNQIAQAEASLAAAEAQVTQSEAEREITRLNWKREDGLFKQGVEPAQAFDQARTSMEAAEARVESLRKQALAAKSAVALAEANLVQVAARRAMLQASTHQLAAMVAQRDKAKVWLDRTEIRAPVDGIVDVRAALQGEVVNPGQAIVTLINPDDLWVRADVEESYIEKIQLGDSLWVRLPSGERRQGKIFYRRVDADYATQRDVSRTKRDIKTFEIRLRCDNHDRSLAVGMTAYVNLRFNERNPSVQQADLK